MRFTRSRRGALLALLAVMAAAGCGSDSPTGGTGNPSTVNLVSDPGDFIGGGLSYGYTQDNATMVVAALDGHLHVEVNGAEGWMGDFQLPDSVAILKPGTYTGLGRYPFHDPAKGGLSWTGRGRGCNTLVGSFTISSATYSGSTLTGVDLTFEQHCEGAAPALRGTLHLRAR